jgi:hypothetical protein
VKNAPEGRRDRLIPLLAQAILQAKAASERNAQHIAPLAVVGAKRVPDRLAKELDLFAQDYAPGVSVGIFDQEGLQWFRGPGLESLSASRKPSERRIRARISAAPAFNLFSDLNQWLLKVLLAPGIQNGLLNAPRSEYRNASELAASAHVSVMSAFRFIRQLRSEGFLNESASILAISRHDELFGRWQAANLAPVRELGLRWILRGDPSQQLNEALRSQVARHASLAPGGRKPTGRFCLGMFAAADALGLGFVRGVAPHIYAERLSAQPLQQLGLSLEPSRDAPDVYVRVPSARQSVFRAAVSREGILVSDVLQVWLDVSSQPSRGAAQAELIYRQVLKPLVSGEKG